jgi:RNA polymerase sigma factor (sigma-70 family)
LSGVSSDPSDASVIALSQSRPEVFATIFERHFAVVHSYLARRLDAALADDLASATFTVAFERRLTFRGSAESARPWLLGIATNLLRNERRAERRALAVVERLPPLDVSSSPPGEGLDRARLADALAALEDSQRDVLLLHAWADLSYKQIAVSLVIPVGTVR